MTTAEPTPPKKGWRTTEFWLTLISMALSLLYMGGAIPGEGTVATIAGLVAAALVAFGYNVSRGLAKMNRR